MINASGGLALVYAFSSGGLLAVQATAHALPIRRMALLEPPIAREENSAEQSAFTAGLTKLINAGRRDAAVEYYLAGIGVPAEIVDDMRGSDAWAAMAAAAPTLVCDCLISEATPYELLGTVTTLSLIIDSAVVTISPAWLRWWPKGCRMLPNGAWPESGTVSPTRFSRSC